MVSTVLVIGGGPAESTAAALLARAGLSVTLLEKETFPRYHIGESIASSCRTIVDFVGALDEIDARGYTEKNGVLLRWGKEDWAIDWTEIFGPGVRSWQVDRDDFDHVLLTHAAKQGATVIEGAEVKRVLFDGDRAVGAEWAEPRTGERRTGTFDFVVDASGRAGLIPARHFKHRRTNETFKNVAIWGYWDGGSLLPSSPQGGINVIGAPDGWYWVIPLRDNRFSVGFVCHQTRFLERRKGHESLEAMLAALVEESPTVRGLMANGTYQPGVRVEQDFSYVSDSFCGPGYFAAGDSACFPGPAAVDRACTWRSTAACSRPRRSWADHQRGRHRGTGLAGSTRRSTATRSSGCSPWSAAVLPAARPARPTYFALADWLVGEHDEAEYERVDGAKAFAQLIAGLADVGDAMAGRNVPPQMPASDEGNSVGQLFVAAEQARRMAEAGVPKAPVSEALNKVDGLELFDPETGLYLMTNPRLGIGRTRSA
uniref:Halogenase n=1 Tax=Catenuloplanes nepalensis TaxID=587533 RepID=B8YGP3_9ACTN|nr:halogenase [Catenuloplanes nepalensis JCM 9536]